MSKPKVENWKKFLQNKIIINDFSILFISIFVVLILRFPEILKGEINNYEIRNFILALLVYILWLFFLSLNGSRDLKILGFGADEYKRLTSSTLLSFTSIAFISYIFKLEISRAFVLLVFPIGLFSLF